MALIRCNECGRGVSDKATTCPHCGAPVELSAAPAQPAPDATQGKPAKKKMSIWQIVIWAFVGSIVFSFFASKKNDTSAPATSTAAQPVASAASTATASPADEKARVSVESSMGCRTQEALGRLITYATEKNVNGAAILFNSGLCEPLALGQDVTILRRVNENIVQIRVRNGLGEDIALWSASAFFEPGH